MELSRKTKEYWEEKDWEDINKASSIKDLFIVALRILNRMPDGLAQICGPISTGGKGSIEANLEEFNNKIKDLQNKGLNIFDQMPFEAPMHKMVINYSKNEYMNSILNDFYLPLFETGRIKELHFLQDWQSSIGANWEHEKAKKLGIKIIYC